MEAAQHSAELEAQALRQQLASVQSSVASLQVSTCGSEVRVTGRHIRLEDCSRGVLLLKITGHAGVKCVQLPTSSTAAVSAVQVAGGG